MTLVWHAILHAITVTIDYGIQLTHANYFTHSYT